MRGGPLAKFEVARFGFHLVVETPLYLPEHGSSAFRGGFGHVFRKVACPLGCTRECQRPQTCTYAYVFETPVPSGSRILAEVGSAPRPFVIEAEQPGGRQRQPGERLEFGLVLIGRAIGYLPYFIYAFEELGRVGLGPARGRYRLERVESLAWPAGAAVLYEAASRRVAEVHCRMNPTEACSPPPPAGPLALEFVSPTQLPFQGSRNATGIRFHVLFRNLLRRVNFLNYFHCGGELMDEAGSLVEKASAIATVEAALEWKTWDRYSNRQAQRIPMRGFTGRVTYRGDFAPFWPWLAAGEFVHVGKSATFGLGRYRLVSLQ